LRLLVLIDVQSTAVDEQGKLLGSCPIPVPTTVRRGSGFRCASTAPSLLCELLSLSQVVYPQYRAPQRISSAEAILGAGNRAMLTTQHPPAAAGVRNSASQGTETLPPDTVSGTAAFEDLGAGVLRAAQLARRLVLKVLLGSSLLTADYVTPVRCAPTPPRILSSSASGDTRL
jgi:hypothetical protein